MLGFGWYFPQDMLSTSLSRQLSLGKLWEDDPSLKERTEESAWDLPLSTTPKTGRHFVKPKCHAFRDFQSGYHPLSLEKVQSSPRSGSSEHSKFSRINSLLSRPLPCTEVGSDAFFSSSSITVFVCPAACSIMVTSCSVLSI